MTEHVLLIAGPAGSGKSTAIDTLFRGAGARAAGLEQASAAVDFGQLELAPGELVRIFSVPARGRYDYMWQILTRRALGVLVLISSAEPEPIAELLAALEEYEPQRRRGGVLVGLTHAELSTSPTLEEVQLALAERWPGQLLPVLTLDARDRAQLITALSVLAASVDSHELLGD